MIERVEAILKVEDVAEEVKVKIAEVEKKVKEVEAINGDEKLLSNVRAVL